MIPFINSPLQPAITLQSPHQLEAILKRMLTTNHIISDLDDTDSPSPAERVAYSSLCQWEKLFSPTFWRWAIPCMIDLLSNGHEAEERQWHTFRATFLTPQELSRHTAWFATHASETLYPGVQEFYSLFPNAKKTYLSRNLACILGAYGRTLHFDYIRPESYDPEAAIHDAISRFPHHRRILFKGDGPKDDKLLSALQGLLQKGTIESLTSISVSPYYSRGLRPGYDLAVRKDYRSLARALAKAQQH